MHSTNEGKVQCQNKEHDDMKATLDGGFKLISDLLKKDAYQERLHEISDVLSSLEKQVQVSQLKLKNDFISTFTQEMKVSACCIKYCYKCTIKRICLLTPFRLFIHIRKSTLPKFVFYLFVINL